MSRQIIYFIITSLLLGACSDMKDTENQKSEEETAVVKPEKVLRHVVMFKFKEEATPEQVNTVEAAFSALPDKIETIHDYEWGTDVGVENLSQGFTHCFIVTFLNEADRDAYLPHPAHKEFGAILGPHLDKALVVDFWTNK